MTLIINNDLTIEESFNEKYNMEFNDCVISIQMYSKDNNLPFLTKFDYSDLLNVIKKNIDFSKIEVINVDEEESSDEELLSDEEEYYD